MARQKIASGRKYGISKFNMIKEQIFVQCEKWFCGGAQDARRRLKKD